MSDIQLSERPSADVERLAEAAREALTDSMVERLTTTSANAMEVVDRLNDPGTSDAIHALIDRVTELHKGGGLDALFDLLRVINGAREAATDSMVERLVTTSGNALQVLDHLNDEDTGAAIEQTVHRLTELHKAGAIDTLFDTVLLLHAARSAATDSIIERLFASFEQMLNTVGTEALGLLAENACHALCEAAEESEQVPAKGGLFTVLSLMAQPQTQRSLLFLLNFGEKLRQRTSAAR
jgi:uncharacterized protein YjgD (DUF1641 family)